MTHELLIPRVKVIADYPDTPWNIGEIIFPLSGRHPNPNYKAAFFEKYPHLFRVMHWAEDRELSEMPEYVKWRSGIVTPARWVDKLPEYLPMDGICTLEMGNIALRIITPAIESDYLTYKNSLK